MLEINHDIRRATCNYVFTEYEMGNCPEGEEKDGDYVIKSVNLDITVKLLSVMVVVPLILKT